MGGGPVVAGRADFEKERDGAVEGSRGWDDDTCDTVWREWNNFIWREFECDLDVV